MKINICYNFEKKSGGGGNFLVTLKKNLIKKGVYTDSYEDTDVIIYNSHHIYEKILDLKFKYPHKTFIHRIDGPMKIYNKKSDVRDEIVSILCKTIADGVIFQSYWSKKANIEIGNVKNKKSCVIYNAPDPELFYKYPRYKSNGLSIRNILIASWSKNINKGFEDYLWLDENIDFNKYHITFIGNSPIKFKNIKMIDGITHKEFAKKIHEFDILIFASRFEACSNLILEALHSGLDVIAYDSSSNRELVNKKGYLYKNCTEITEILSKINNVERKNFFLKDIDFVSYQYYSFCDYICRNKNNQSINFSKFNKFIIEKYIQFINLKSKMANYGINNKNK